MIAQLRSLGVDILGIVMEEASIAVTKPGRSERPRYRLNPTGENRKTCTKRSYYIIFEATFFLEINVHFF